MSDNQTTGSNSSSSNQTSEQSNNQASSVTPQKPVKPATSYSSLQTKSLNSDDLSSRRNINDLEK